MTRRKLPYFTENTKKNMADSSFFTHALIFDDLLIIAQKETNCFVLNTGEGLILIDAIWPGKDFFEAIVSAVKSVGWSPDEIKKLVITHGHADHTGCGKYFVDNYHVTTYLSETDDEFWDSHPAIPDRTETYKDFNIDVYIGEGDSICLGNKEIKVVSTPGHTPGCLSFIFPVMEDGIVHMAALWGGTAPPASKEDIKQYLDSLERFQKIAEKENVDVALSNHTAVDNGLERIAYSKKRTDYLPNIYIIGKDGFSKYCEVFRNLAAGAADSI